MLPKTCEMPDLSGLESIIPGLMTSLLGFRGHRLTEKEKKYYRVFLRLVNKAHKNYQEAREAIITYLHNREYVLIIPFDFVDYIENCLNAVRRLYGVLENVKREKRGGLTTDRTQFKIINQYFEETKKIRDVIEHLDEFIQKDILEGPIILTISEDDKHVGIGEHSIGFDELAKVILMFYEIGRAWQEDFVGQK
jgi:hypothetical protein